MVQHSAPNWTPWPLSCVSDVWGRKSWDLPFLLLLVGHRRETAAMLSIISLLNLSTSTLTTTGVYPRKKYEFLTTFSLTSLSGWHFSGARSRNVNRLHLAFNLNWHNLPTNQWMKSWMQNLNCSRVVESGDDPQSHLSLVTEQLQFGVKSIA